jgi:hypothetical protein
MPKPKHLATQKGHNYSSKKPCFHRHLSSCHRLPFMAFTISDAACLPTNSTHHSP